ncbi:MAG TPA: SOS response-associated peptidase [Thermodesulfobacteriota bacterium]|nr:SOS response-associated peptidase [Thermodesulfobacteriota bacterium]
MCGRMTLTTDKDDIQSRWGFIDPSGVLDLIKPRFNISPSQNSPTVIVNQDNRELKMMRWGLIPFWAKEASIGYKMINAKAETVHEKPSFRKSFKDKRCLVLADGFYEWTKTDKKNKIPFRFVLKTKEPFAFAGLWDAWKTPEGEMLLTFTIITTNANELMEPIHDRMPVILHEKDEALWLDPEFKDANKLTALLKPFPSDKMEAYRVSTIVNSPKNDTPKCIEPVGSM